MASVFCIMDIPWRGMGNQHVEPFQSPQREPEFADLGPHLALPVLVGITIIPTGTGESQEPTAARFDYPAGDIGATLDNLFVPDIMISQDVIERYVVLRSEPDQIFRGQITTAENQFYPSRPNWAVAADQFGHNDIRYAQNSHPGSPFIRCDDR